MADFLKTWLHERLGLLMDLTPEIFGHYTRDGTLLAGILHSYDIINKDQLSTVFSTHDPALSRVNLKTLRIWLKLINVTLNNECIEDISKGKGSVSLQLFYKVYLSLEGKDRLHFIALQKEQKYMPTPSRFDVTKVCEEPSFYQAPEHPLSHPLIEDADTINWHKRKFQAFTKASRRERERLKIMMHPIVEYFVPEEFPDKKEEESKRLDEFSHEHPAGRIKKRYQMVECCPGKRLLDLSCVKDPSAAVHCCTMDYVDFLKKRNEKALKSHKLKLKTQKSMITEAWERLLKKQDRLLDEALGMRTLDLSRYEKQMISKLYEVHDLRNKIVENRRIVDVMLLKFKENEQLYKEDYDREIMKDKMEDVEIEARRMRELRQRIRDEKMRRMREKHRGICLKVVEDLADIAVKVAEYRQTNGNHIPHFTWNEWKTSFLKNQPIFEFVEDLDDIEEKEEVRNEEEAKNDDGIKSKNKLESEEKQRLIQFDLERQRTLADTDFESYRVLAPPWNEFVPKREGEADEIPKLGRIVLGYVIHRLLEVLYPVPTEIMTCSVPRVKIAAIILGITNITLHEQLQKLLKNSGVYLVKMEDAINHCLERYKWEMTDVDYIDLNIISATTRDIKRVETKKKIDDSRNHHPKKLEKTTKATRAQQSAADAADEKQTQTPRQIPYDDMDPILTDTAYIGKWTYEFLTLGQPISNELNTKILIEYLKGIGNVEGWVLINYPTTYEQMAMLEKALTGREVPLDRKIINFADLNIEEIDCPSPRIVFEGDEVDTFTTCRQSRLLPNPISRVKDSHSSSKTFITMYIKAMLKPKTLDTQDQFCIPLPDDATSMDEYYADQNIAYGFFYNVLDDPTLNQLVKLIIGQFPERKPFFEEILQEYYDQKLPIDTNAAIIKRLVLKSKWESLGDEEKKDIEAERRDLQLKVQMQLANDYIRPGEDNWQWIDFFQPPNLLEILAVLWESIEEAYVENLKEILSLKRMQASAVIPYKNFILKNLMKFVDRPDNRQILLHDFQCVFNEIDQDLREDVDMKCELHCRVDDFRTKLWELCDVRRREAEEERRRTLQNKWILVEAVVLVNVYIGILQTEIDRFVDTMQLLQDYYTSMSQKPLQESLFSKIVLDQFKLEDVLENSSMEDKEEDEMMLKTKSELAKASSRAANIEQFKTEIESLLIEEDLSKSFDPDQTAVHNAIKDNIRQVRDVVDSISSSILEMLKKEEKAAVVKTEIKTKSIRDASPDSMFTKLAKRNRDLIEEWRYAVLFELDRIHQMLDVLNAAAQSDVAFLLDTMRLTFHRIQRYIVERYKREIESINEMADVFCFAIEEEKPIQQQLLLDGAQFVIRPNVLMFPESPSELTIPVREVPLPLQFRIVQLGRLVDIFRRIVPREIISERALVYILQDLVSCGEEDYYPPSVPCAWRQLQPPDVEKLIERLFGAIEYIEWREFILYAMELPVPSYEDLLNTRAAFRIQDPELKEVIPCNQFHLIPLWFLEISNFRENFLDEEPDHGDPDEITNLMLREEARLGDRVPNLKSDFIETSEDFGAIPRLMLAKELLCQMYLKNQNTVHYTAMLLAFCKDEDPRDGLGKAFTLVMGARVCTDVAEGERYVRELAKKRRIRKLQLSQDYLLAEANEIAREIVNHIIHKTMKAIAVFEKKLLERDLAPRDRIMIQQLDGLDEIDPADLLQPEIAAESLVIEDLENNDAYEPVPSFVSVSSVPPEEYENEREGKMIFWVPRDVCLTVLSTCLPWFASQADLFQTSLSLNEGIARVYNELANKELNDEENVVLAHRLVNHSFIHDLLYASSKFTWKNMTNLLRDILTDKSNVTI